MQVGTETKTGADCTGNEGDSNRTLTLANTGHTIQNGFLVYVSGLALALTDEYTVSHNNSGTVITFLNPLWNDMTVIVNYYQSTGPSITNDFENGPLSDFGVIVVRTPVTMTTDFHGNKTYTDGTDENIEVVFENPSKKFPLDASGLTEVYDARMFIKPTQTLNKYDKITYDSKVYRVDTVSKRNFDGNTVFQTATLFFIEDE